MAAPTNAANVKKALANSEPSTHDPKQTSGPHNNALPCRLHRSRNVLVFRFVPMGRGVLAPFNPCVYRKPHPVMISDLVGKNSLFLRQNSQFRRNNSLFCFAEICLKAFEFA
jgi:hypothetical protein